LTLEAKFSGIFQCGGRLCSVPLNPAIPPKATSSPWWLPSEWYSITAGRSPC